MDTATATARLAAATAFRIRGALTARTLLPATLTLVTLELLALAGPGGPAQLSIVTAVALGFPVLSWLARQALDAAPDDEVLLVRLSLGSRVLARIAALSAAGVLVLPATLLCVAWGASNVDESGLGSGGLAAGALLGLMVAVAAVAVGSLASRAVVGRGAGSVLVLVGIPFLTAVVGAARSPVVNALVPRLGPALRAANDGMLPSAVPGIAAQILLWSVLLLAVLWRRLPG